MNRKELIQTLQSAMAAERTSAVCIDNMIGTFTWSGLPAEKRDELVRHIETLAAAAQRRSERLERLIRRLERSDQDVL